jgi:pimeloyl-ACP methyl ester carboxylesterase
MTAQLDAPQPARLSDVELPELNPESDRWPGRKVRVVGVDVHVRTAAGPEGAERALLIHGLGGAATNWTDFASLLSSQLEVEAIDLPGFGFSGPSLDGSYSIAMQTATVIAYLDESKRSPADAPGAWRGPVHLVGNSMGGLIALQVAALRPDLVRTLTLISPAVPDLHAMRAQPLKNDWRMAFLVVPGLGEMGVRRMARMGVEARLKGTLGVCFAHPETYPASRVAQDIEDVTTRTTEQPWANKALLRATRALVRVQYFQRRVTWNRMNNVVAPTLVMWGDSDRLVAPDLAPHVAASIPGARLRVFEDTGHTAMMERPVEAARCFFGLIEDVAAGKFAPADDVTASAVTPS